VADRGGVALHHAVRDCAVACDGRWLATIAGSRSTAGEGRALDVAPGKAVPASRRSMDGMEAAAPMKAAGMEAAAAEAPTMEAAAVEATSVEATAAVEAAAAMKSAKSAAAVKTAATAMKAAATTAMKAAAATAMAAPAATTTVGGLGEVRGCKPYRGAREDRGER
jgi:hypothetical protein